MLKVNLLPKAISAGPPDQPIVLVIGIVVTVAALGGSGVLYTMQQRQLNDAQAKLEAIDVQYNRERGEIEAAEAAQQELRYLEDKEKWVLSQTNTQREWGTFLAEMKDRTPQDTWLTEIKANQTKKELEIKGRAFTMGAVAHLTVQYDVIDAIDSLRVKDVVRSETIIEQNQREINAAKERQKNSGDVVEIPDKVPGLGFAVRNYNPVDFSLEGKFELKPGQAKGAAGPPPTPGGNTPPPPGGAEEDL